MSSSIKDIIRTIGGSGTTTEIIVADVISISPLTFQARSDKQLLVTERSVIVPDRVKKELAEGDSVYLLFLSNVIYCLDKLEA